MTYIAIRDRALEIVDKGSRGDIYSRSCDLFLSLLIIFNLICVSLESVDSLGERYGDFFQVVEIVSLVLFTLECSVRSGLQPRNTISREQGYLAVLGIFSVLPVLSI